MQTVLSPKETTQEVKTLLHALKEQLKTQTEGRGYLDLELESSAKHLPAYLKIVKGHIEQLAKVLQLETHDNRSLESVGLAEPVIQLMQLFRELQEEDILLLENLGFEARNWQLTDTSSQTQKEPLNTRMATEV